MGKKLSTILILLAVTFIAGASVGLTADLVLLPHLEVSTTTKITDAHTPIDFRFFIILLTIPD